MPSFEVTVARYATQYHKVKIQANDEQDAIRDAEYLMDEDDAWEKVADPEVAVEVINCEEVCSQCGAKVPEEDETDEGT